MSPMGKKWTNSGRAEVPHMETRLWCERKKNGMLRKQKQHVFTPWKKTGQMMNTDEGTLGGKEDV